MSNRMKQYLLETPSLHYKTPLVLCIIGILFFSSVPGDKLPEIGFFQWDKFAHAFEYMVLSLLVFRYFNLYQKKELRSALKAGVAFCAVFLVLDELHQKLIPLRTCALEDGIADFSGVLLALGLYVRVAFFRVRTEPLLERIFGGRI